VNDVIILQNCVTFMVMNVFIFNLLKFVYRKNPINHKVKRYEDKKN